LEFRNPGLSILLTVVRHLKQMNRKTENIIVHTTRSFDNLKSILTSKSLKLKFSCENFYCKNFAISKAAHPMVCFSEYDPDTIQNQTITYGRYAIGFSKTWARNKKIGPVLYVSSESSAAQGMKKLLIARRSKNEKLDPKVRLAIMEVKCFMKNERGINSNLDQSDFDFKSENEWRFVPQKQEIKNYLISQNQGTYLKNKSRHDKKLEAFPLKFQLEDLEVVYVNDDLERNELIKLTGLSSEKVKIATWKIK
jgi:hypothetical protein